MIRKLGPLSIWTSKDQEAWYREQMGDEKTEEQIRKARLEAGQCVCEGQKLKRHWNGEGSPLSVRTIHTKECPKWKPWMSEV